MSIKQYPQFNFRTPKYKKMRNRIGSVNLINEDMFDAFMKDKDNSIEEVILNLGPKRLHRMGLLHDNNPGWRAGFTKKTIQKRKQERKQRKRSQ